MMDLVQLYNTVKYTNSLFNSDSKALDSSYVSILFIWVYFSSIRCIFMSIFSYIVSANAEIILDSRASVVNCFQLKVAKMGR